MTTTLRELFLVPAERPGPTADADAEYYARFRFGEAVAGRIQWADDEELEVTGKLTDGLETLYLRYECNEPGSRYIYARVPCPVDARCQEAWDVVEDVDDLLSVLDGNLGAGDPVCDAGHDIDCDDLDDEEIGEEEPTDGGD